MISLKDITKCGILACLLYVMWYKWVFGENTIILYSAAAISVGCMFLDLLLSKISMTRVFPYGCVNNIIMCAYSLFTGIFVASSQSVLLSTVETYFAFSLVCLAFCYASIDTGFDWLLKGFIFIAILCSIWTLTNGYYRTGYGYVLSQTNNPHTLAYVMVLGLFSLAYLSKTTIRSFVFHMIVSSLFLYMIIQCGSRKGLLAAALIVIPWLLVELKIVYKNGTTLQKVGLLILFLLLACGVIYYYLHTFVNTTSFERLSKIEESQANKERLSYFNLGFEFYLKSPIFGIGLGQFAVLNSTGAYAHSTFPETIASWGTIGTLLYFIPIFTVCYRVFISLKNKIEKKTVMVFALCMMEIFMAFLQIYFYSLTHMVVWAIIFIFIKNQNNNNNYNYNWDNSGYR